MTSQVIIPARRNSVGIHRKNMVEMGGHPLIWWSIRAAQYANVHSIIVSTDDELIRTICSEITAVDERVHCVDQPSPMRDGVVNAVNVPLWWIEYCKSKGIALYDVIVMLLPTQPFRSPKHIQKAVRRVELGAESVIGVSDAKPLECLRVVNDRFLKPVTVGDLTNIQRQDVNKIVAVNGAVYASRPETLLEHRTFHTSRAEPLFMPPENSLDINDIDDLEMARKFAQIMQKELRY